MERREFDSQFEFVTRNIEKKLERLSARLQIIKHVLALYRYMIDPEIHWTRKVLVVGALVYFIVPADMIPDFTPLVGYLDDAAVLAAVIKTLGKGFLKYYRQEPALEASLS